MEQFTEQMTEDDIEYMHEEAIVSCKILIAILEANISFRKKNSVNRFNAAPPHGALIAIQDNVSEIFDIEEWLKENDD